MKTPTPTLNVLIIDDEESIRAVTLRMLENLGHHCAVAPDAESALACLQQAPAGVVVCDYRLGEQTADGLLAELLARYPGLERRVILCTGATTERGVEELVERHGLCLLAKPFGKADLAQALNVVSLLIPSRGRDIGVGPGGGWPRVQSQCDGSWHLIFLLSPSRRGAG